MRCATDFVLTGGLWAVVVEKHCSNINDVRYYFFAVCVKRTPAFFAIDPLDSSRQTNARRSRPTLRVQKCRGRVQQYINRATRACGDGDRARPKKLIPVRLT